MRRGAGLSAAFLVGTPARRSMINIKYHYIIIRQPRHFALWITRMGLRLFHHNKLRNPGNEAFPETASLTTLLKVKNPPNVMPAKTGIQKYQMAKKHWTPAFAGVTENSTFYGNDKFFLKSFTRFAKRVTDHAAEDRSPPGAIHGPK
jgi:hypothetical protein